ncbi:Uncharacterised protein [Vibrio cholerae]|nr:Uncharacterised protein [Vibrio cholerae]
MIGLEHSFNTQLVSFAGGSNRWDFFSTKPDILLDLTFNCVGQYLRFLHQKTCLLSFAPPLIHPTDCGDAERTISLLVR